MNISDITLPENINAETDETKKRIEIQLDGGRIIAYYPIENLQAYVYEINGGKIPDLWDLGLRMNYTGRYIRILICKYGHGDFTENGVSLNLNGGEFALKYGPKEKNRFSFTADNLVGIELIMQVDYAVEESLLFKMLKSAFRNMGITEKDFKEEEWYFSNYSGESENSVDRLIKNCAENADSALVMINITEIGYNLGNDYKESDSKERKYPTNLQKAIAEDIHLQLTEKYSERCTALMFAEKYGLSATTVKNYFKNVYGYSFKEYQMKVRMEKAEELLTTTDMKLVEIAMSIGYSTQAKFISAFKKHYNMTPSKYRLSNRISRTLQEN